MNLFSLVGQALGRMKPSVVHVFFGLALLLQLPGAIAGPDQPTWAANCGTCHGATPPVQQRNGANSTSVITAANSLHGMGEGPFLSAGSNLADMASYIGSVTTTAGSTVNLAYHGTTGTLTVPNVTLNDPTAGGSGVVTVFGGSASSGNGTVNGVGTTALTYTHTASNCSADTVNAFGSGPGAVTTSNRTIPISITAPTITAPSPTLGIAYSTGSTSLSLGGTVNVLGITITGTPANGTAGVVDTNTLSYAASASTYKAQVTIGYRGEGPGFGTGGSCGSQNGTVTVNVGLPPAPTVTDVGSAGTPMVVSSVAATPIDVSAYIAGVVASNPAATYAVNASQPTAGASGTSGVAGNIVTYTPTGAFTGATTITYTKAGPGGTSNTGTIYLNVSAAPTVAATSATTAYNTMVSINLNSSITSGSAVTAVTPSSPTNGTAAQTGTTTIQFTPTPGFFGTGSFLYTASNVSGASGTALVTVTVNPPPPTVSATTATIPYNTATAINLASSIGPGGATVLSVTPSGAVGGTAVATGPSTITFTPTTGLVGAASFNYAATNAGGTSAGTATVSVTISPPAAPTVRSGTVNVLVNTPVTFDLGNFASGIFSSATIVAPPGKGTATVSGTVVTYTPNPGYLGSDTLTFNVTGLGGTSGNALVTFNMAATPNSPAISRSTPMNKTLTIDVNGIATGSFTSITVTPPPNGLATVNGKVITYVPKTGFIGRETFTYLTVGGTVGNSPTPGLITIDVLPPPTAKDTTMRVPVNVASTLNLASLLTGTAITRVDIQTAPQNGTVTVSGTSVTYTPIKDFFGSDSFTYVTVDTLAGNSLPATVTVTVVPLLPTANTVTINVNMNGSTSFNLADYITGSLITGVGIVTRPKLGNVDVSGTIITYTPKQGLFGTDSFTYTAFGAAGKSTPGSVTVNITGRPNPADDPSVTNQINSQTQISADVASGQLRNINMRLENLRSHSALARNAAAGLVAPTGVSASSLASAAAQGLATPSATANVTAPGSVQLPVGNAPVALPLSTGLSMAANDMGLASSPLFSLAAGLAQNRTLDIGVLHRSLAGDTLNTTDPLAMNMWMEGVVSFGQRDASGNLSGTSFNSTGLTVGVDKALSDKTTIGMGLGYAQNTTYIGTDGSRNQAKGYSLAVYGSYMPSKNTFVDGVLGIGSIDFDSTRFVQPVTDYALSTRKAYQYFGSIGGGYELRNGGTLISPYARLEFSNSRLGESTEAGAGNYALTYYEQKSTSMQGVLGLRGEALHATPFGWVAPRARIEWRQDLRDNNDAVVSYADQMGAVRYTIPQGSSQNGEWVWGIGSDFVFRNGWTIGVDYQLSRVSTNESNFAFRVLATKELGARGMPKLSQALDQDAEGDDGITVDTGYTWDDNISRGKVAGDIQADSIYSLNVSKTKEMSLGSNTRLLLTGTAGGERFQNFNGLSRYTLTGDATVQYRSSSEFDAPTWGAFAKLIGENYQSDMRDGYRYSLGVSVLQPLTDRITVFGALARNNRRANNEVFSTQDSSARLNIDYALGRGATLYLGGEYRKGDIVSSGQASLENITVAKLFAQDDAFGSAQYVSYKLDATTWLGTVGYNLNLGARDSLDFAWRRVVSTPGLRPVWATSPNSYTTNQLSASYLMRF